VADGQRSGIPIVEIMSGRHHRTNVQSWRPDAIGAS
jgi:hypothetical protein